MDVAVAVVERDGRILFLRRDRDPMRGLWELPGGKIEPGESPAACALRELFEETGLEGRVERDLGLVVHEYTWSAVRLHAFEVVAEGPPRRGEFLPVEAWGPEGVLPGTWALVQTLLNRRFRTDGSDKPS